VCIKSEMTVNGDAESLYSVGKGNHRANSADSSKRKVATKLLPGAKSNGFGLFAV
jgi:hypothetical protein